MIELNENKLIEILTLLRLESRKLGVNPTEDDVRNLMKKYNMLFVGENFNKITSLELNNALKNIFNIDSTMDDLNALIPVACGKLNMEIEPLAYVENIGKDVIDCYYISL